MINVELLNYIKQQLSLNTTKETIASNLKTQEWTDEDIKEAFAILEKQSIPAAPVITTQPQPKADQPPAEKINTDNFLAEAPTTSPEKAEPQVQKSFEPQIINPNPSPVAMEISQNQEIVEERSSQVKQPARRHKGLIIGVVLLLLILGAGGAYAYFIGYFVSFDKVLLQSINNISNIESVAYDATVKVTYPEKTATEDGVSSFFAFEKEDFDFTLLGAFDLLDKNDTKFSSTITSNSGSYKGSLDFRYIAKKFYLKVSNVPVLELIVPKELGIFNKWYYFDKEEDAKEENKNDMIGDPLLELLGIDSSILNELETEEKDKIYEMSTRAKIFSITEKFADEKIGGTNTYHFAFTLNKEGIFDYLVKLKSYVNQIGKDSSTLSAFDPMDAYASIEKIDSFRGEMWIGKKDSLPYKANITFRNLNDDKSVESNASIFLVLKDWNIPQGIEEPQGAGDIKTLLEDLFSDSRKKGTDAAVKSSLVSARAQAELYYDNNRLSYSGVCATGRVSLYNHGIKEQVENAGNYSKKTPVCKDSKAAWAASVELSTPGEYWCVDSMGNSFLTSSPITITKCPQRSSAPIPY